MSNPSVPRTRRRGLLQGSHRNLLLAAAIGYCLI